MKRTKIITGLDIGSSKVSAITISIDKGGQLSITGQATGPSRGVSAGAITDLNDAVRSVSSVLKKLRQKAPDGLGDIYVNISGQALKGTRSAGMIPLAVRGREITRPDIARCIDAASTIRLPFDREIVHKIVQRFSVDDQPWIKDPLGLYASRISCEVYIITAAVNSIQNIFKCVNNAGYDAKEVVYTGIADANAVLEKGDKEAGVLLLSMGAALTGISIFSEGALCDMEILQTGAEDFKDGYKENPAFNGLVSKIALKIKDMRSSGKSMQSMVVTGGIIFSDGVIEFLEEKLSIPVKMGVAKDIRGEVSGPDNVRFCTAIGLAKHAIKKYENMPQVPKNFTDRVTSAVADIFNNYF
ncbi:MAG: cell division protein FtsA [Candidatus Omnitrophota bacterium]